MVPTFHQWKVFITLRALRAMIDSGQEWDFFLGMQIMGGISKDDDSKQVVNRYPTLRGRELLVVTDRNHPCTRILVPEED